MSVKIAALLILWWGLLVIGWVLRGWVCVGLMVVASTVVTLLYAEISHDEK